MLAYSDNLGDSPFYTSRACGPFKSRYLDFQCAVADTCTPIALRETSIVIVGFLGNFPSIQTVSFPCAKKSPLHNKAFFADLFSS